MAAENAQNSDVSAKSVPTFTTLPRELRDMINEYLLIQQDSVITMLGDQGCYRNEIDAAPPPICAVNRQLRAETTPVFYSRNTFTAQLDNTTDLNNAKAWLAAITNENVRHLRKLLFRGWTRVPFGHMVSKRWVQMVFDLQAGTMEVESKEGDYFSDRNQEEYPVVGQSIEELKAEFMLVAASRDGAPFDAQSVAALMDGFNGLCVGY